MRKICLFLVMFCLLAALVFQAGPGLLWAAWSGPTDTAPNDNVPAPLNVGVDVQTKEGGLWLNTSGASPFGLIVEAGDAGIGITTPAERLEVADSTAGTARIRITDVAQNPEFQLQYSAGGHWAIYNEQAADDLRFWNPTSNDVMTILQNGNIGIGDTTPSGQLDVNSSGTDQGVYLDGRAALTGYDGDNWLRLNQNGSFTSGVRLPAGDFYIDNGALTVTGDISDPGSNLILNDWVDIRWGVINGGTEINGANNSGWLYLNDDVEVNGNIEAAAFLYSSDRRLKENIAPIKDPLSRITQLSGVEFTWKESGRKGIGLVAQELEKVFPELVRTADSGSGLKTVEYGQLVAPLINAVKEQQVMIEELRAEVEKLKQAQ